MIEKGFAIRCPHCRKWMVHANVHPMEVALESKLELRRILQGLSRANIRGESDSFSHSKLLRCESPRWHCPASFEAFVCRSESEAFEFLEQVDAWSFKRDFRLCKADCKGRWDDEKEGKYYAILFNTQPVARRPEIELEQLLDRGLLSRTILGVTQEIQAPFTIFSANVFKHKGGEWRAYWMPIESYSMGQNLIPEAFNEFCKCFRGIIVDELIQKFETNKFNVDNCPIAFGENGMCAGKTAACKEKPKDWNHCPAFRKERRNCLCTSSDLQLIWKIETDWKNGNSSKKGVLHKCPAGFTEIGFPIVVHDHIVGIGMTGQFFFDEKDIEQASHLIKDWSTLQGYESNLESARQLLLTEEKQLQKQGKPHFGVNERGVEKIVTLISANLVRIEEMANSRYRDFRSMSESVFRKEIRGFIQNHKRERDFFEARVPHVLERMRVFWGFEAVYLAQYSFKSKEFSVMAFSHKYMPPTSFGVPGKILGQADVENYQTHPTLYLHLKGGERPRYKSYPDDLLPLFEEASTDLELEVPEGECYFFVLVPFLEEVYVFVFAVRDEAEISILTQRAKGSVSQLCQDAILETCIEVVHEFREVRYREAIKQKIKLDAWRSLSARTAHKINNRLFAAYGALRRQRETNPEFVGIKDLESALKRIGIICNDFRRFVTEHPLNHQLVKVKSIIDQEVSLYRQAAPWKKIDVVISETLPKCKWDPLQMEQVISELLENAIHYSPTDAKVSISVEHFKKKCMDMIRITVNNNGSGIEQANKSKIFEPFFSTRPERPGLGLAIVVRIVESHQGTISERGEPGKNAKFVIELPVQLKKE